VFGGQTDPVALAGTALEATAALGYLGLAALARRGGRGWPAWRVWCFLAGLAVVALTLQSAVARYDDIFWVHVMQHQLLMCIAAALLSLGAPILLALRVVPAVAGRRVVGVLHCRGLDWMNRPAAAVHLPAHYLGMMYLYLLTPAYALSERHIAIHETVHAFFLACGLMFWAPVLGQLPSRWRPSHRTKQLMVAVGLPANLLLAVLVALLGEPALGSRATLLGVLALAVGGVATTAFGLVLLQATKTRRRVSRMSVAATGTTPDGALLAVTRRA
jgi:putative copper resistance protein D